MAEQKQGGLGKGLAALIPSGPDAPTRKPRLGDSAADIILGNSTPQPGRKGGEGKRVKGAPTIQQGSGSQSSKTFETTSVSSYDHQYTINLSQKTTHRIITFYFACICQFRSSFSFARSW